MRIKKKTKRKKINCKEKIMEKIASFTVNHIDLLAGIYVSRRDSIGSCVLTTFDLRFTMPNREPVMDTPGIHTIEHLGATFLRNHPQWKDRVIYFGPMGCRTGFYMILAGKLDSSDVVPLASAWSALSFFKASLASLRYLLISSSISF